MNLEIDGLAPHPPAFRATSLASSRLRTEPRRESLPADPADALHAPHAREIARRTRLVRAAKLRAFRRHGRLELTDEELDAVLPDVGLRRRDALERAAARLDAETVRRVRELVAAGLSGREAGRRLGVGQHAVRVAVRAGESGAGDEQGGPPVAMGDAS